MTSQTNQPVAPRVRTPLPSAAVVLILVIGSAFWIISRGIGATPQAYLDLLGLVPETSFAFSNWYRFLSYSLVHFDPVHFATNLLGIATVSFWLRARNKPIPLLVLFLAGVVAAGIAHVLVFPQSSVPLMGASGGLATVIGAAMITKLPGRALKAAVVLFAAAALIAIIYRSAIGGQALPLAGDTSQVAHVAGFAFGVLVGRLMKARPESH